MGPAAGVHGAGSARHPCRAGWSRPLPPGTDARRNGVAVTARSDPCLADGAYRAIRWSQRSEPLASDIGACPGRPHRSPPMAAPPRVVRRTRRGVPDAARVLGLLPRAARFARCHTFAPGTSGTRTLTVVGVHAAGFPPSQDPRGGAGRGRAARRALPGRGRHRIRDLGAVREPRMAGAVPVQPARDAAPLPLRRRWLRRDRARDPGASRYRRADRSPRSGPRRRRTRGWSPQTDDVEGPYSGPYTAGEVWAVLDGSGIVAVNGRSVAGRPSRRV